MEILVGAVLGQMHRAVLGHKTSARVLGVIAVCLLS